MYWAEEIVRYAIIWCVLLGSSTLIRKHGHIAISYFKDRLKPQQKSIVEMASDLLALTFALVLAYAGWQMVASAWSGHVVSDSRLQTPMWIPYLIMPLSGLLMAMRFAQRLAQRKLPPGWWRQPLTYVVGAVVALMVYHFFTSANAILTLLLALALFLLMGMPVAFAMGLAALGVAYGFDIVGLSGVASKLFWGINKFDLLAIPFFIVAGEILAKSRLGIYLLELASTFVRRIHGGLGIAIIIASILFAAMSGSSVANAAALGLIAFPMLAEKGYPKTFTAGLLAAGGTLAIIIPPSTILVLYGSVAGQSITDLFIAGILPGILVGFALILYVYVVAKKNGYGRDERPFSWPEAWASLKKSLWALLMPIIVLGSIYTGITTPTEAAAVASVYAILACVVLYRDVKVRDLIHIFKEAADLTSMIYAVVMTAALFGFVVTMEQLPQKLLDLTMSAGITAWEFLIIVNLVIFGMGFFLGPAPIVVMMVPILLPIAVQLGVDPIHLGILMTINMELAFLTPPVGTNLYVLSGVSKLPVADVVRGVTPFVVIMLISLFVITFIPDLSLALLR